MMKKLWLFAVLMVFALGSVGLAADSHTVTVSINSFARISVTGTASGVVSETDFDLNGNAAKDLNSTVQITVKTNKNTGCVISASAPDFANVSSNFAISALQVKFGTEGSYVPLANTSTALVNLNTPQNNVSYPVSFRLILNGNEPAGDYNTVVTYTIAPNI